MSYFARPQETYRIHLGDYERERGLPETAGWVDIKLRRSLADKEAMQMAGLRSTGVTGRLGPAGEFKLAGEIPIEKFDQGAVRKELFARMLVRWNLQDDDGADVPCYLEHALLLDEDLQEWLAEQMFGYYERRRPSAEAFLRLNGTSTARST